MLNLSKALTGFFLALANMNASAVVIRHDIPDMQYRTQPTAFPTLVDLPSEGHGVLITPNWVVTAGHAIFWQLPLRTVVIAGQPRKVAKVFFHPGFHPLPNEMQKAEPSVVMAYIEQIDDIALVQLAEPVSDVTPTALYRSKDEVGKIVEIAGSGATGDGLTGELKGSPHRGILRHAFNLITVAQGRWLIYRMDQGIDALPLEGALGHGDSGGPVFMQEHGVRKLAGLANHTFYKTDPGTTAAGKYGDLEYQIRISYYADWIDTTISAQTALKAD